MHPNRAPRLHDGYADELEANVYWQESTTNDWAEVMLTPSDLPGARYLGTIRIEDAQHNVFRLGDGRTVAQLEHMSRNDRIRPVRGYALIADEFNAPNDDWRTIVYKPTGDEQYEWVRIIDGMRMSVFRLPNGKYLAQMEQMTMNASAPPPPRRRRRTVDPSLRRVGEIVRREERPFDPEQRYPRETKPLHFAINAGEWNYENLRDPKGKSFELRFLPYLDTMAIVGYEPRWVKRGYGYGRWEEFFDTLDEARDRMRFLIEHEAIEDAEILQEVSRGSTRVVDEWKEGETYASNASGRAWITYDLVTPESAEEGDVEERGYAAPGGWTFPTDATGEEAKRIGDENALSVDAVLRWALDHRGYWRGEHGTYYDEGDPDVDYSTGAETRYAIHFEVSPGSMRRIERLLGVRH